MQSSAWPQELRDAVDIAHEAMQCHVQHQLLPSYRRAIYAALDPAHSGQGYRTVALLAIMAVKYVLPLYQQRPLTVDELTSDPERIAETQRDWQERREIPPRLIKLAEEVVQGVRGATDDEVNDILRRAYEMSPNGWAKADDPWRTDAIACAAQQALSEACGTVPLDLAGEGCIVYGEDGGVAAFEIWTDEDLANDVLFGDTAASAAMAYASDDIPSVQPLRYDPSKLRAFWDWWLTVALPAAWAEAQNYITEPPRHDCPEYDSIGDILGDL